jgi:HEAT repeats
MTKQGSKAGWLATLVLVATALSSDGASAAAPESKRLIRARDYIAEEQWAKAIELLRAAEADSKEPRRDEALYWLAHSLDSAGDPGEAVATISRLERDFSSSIWVRPAQSLRIAIAVRLQRSDVLWYTATHPAPARPPAPPQPGSPPPAAKVPVPRMPQPRDGGKAPALPPPPVPPPSPMWYSDVVGPDTDLKIQALGGLMKVDPDRVVPILSQFAFESEDPGPAIRAVFMLAQSSLPKARETVVKVARTASDPVKIAAVRDLGRFGGPEIANDLLSVYVTANEPVKWQIVKSLGERSEQWALLTIVKTEKDGRIRSSAIVTLGQAGGGAQLAAMYKSATRETRRSIIGGLFFARAEGELIRVAEIERTPGGEPLRNEALARLRLLGTPGARQYLQKISEKR